MEQAHTHTHTTHMSTRLCNSHEHLLDTSLNPRGKLANHTPFMGFHNEISGGEGGGKPSSTSGKGGGVFWLAM